MGASGYMMGAGLTLGGAGDIVGAITHHDPKFPGPTGEESHYRNLTHRALRGASHQYESAMGLYNQLAPILLSQLPGVHASAVADPGKMATLQQLQDQYDKLNALYQQRGDLRANVRAAGNPVDKRAARGQLRDLRKQIRSMPKLGDVQDALDRAQSDPGLYNISAAPTLEDSLNQQYQDAVAQRAYDAAAGNANFDPYLTRQLDEQQRQFEETMRRHMGPDWESSTPGMQAAADFQQRKTESLRNDAMDEMLRLRQGQLGGQVTLQDIASNNQNLYAGVPHSLADFANGLANYTNTYNAAQAPFQFDRSGMWQQATAALNESPWAGALRNSGNRLVGASGLANSFGQNAYAQGAS